MWSIGAASAFWVRVSDLLEEAPKALFLQTEERKVVTTVLEAASTGVIRAR